jgi:hypothetical protein
MHKEMADISRVYSTLVATTSFEDASRETRVNGLLWAPLIVISSDLSVTLKR